MKIQELKNVHPVGAALLILTIVVNIAWPLTNGSTRIACTIAGVLLLALTSLTHLLISRATSVGLVMVMSVLIGALVIEIVGVNTQFPFGHYEYSDDLGLTVLGVPLLIPLAWFMMLYPSYLIGRKISTSPIHQSLIAGWLMATWDLYLDPQMVREGYWIWFSRGGEQTQDIPLTNFLGWFVAASMLAYGLTRCDRKPVRNESITLPVLSVLWIWLGGFIVNVGWLSPFLNRPTVGFAGFIGMGIVLIPMWRKLWS